MIRSLFSHSRGDAADDAPLDPEVAADLEQLEAALRGESIEDDVLATLVRDVQAQAPVLPDDLRKQLRHDVATGFAKRGAAPRSRTQHGVRTQGATSSPSRVRRPLLATTGVLASAALVFTVIAVAGHGDGQLDSATSSASSTAPVPIDQLMNTFDSGSGDAAASGTAATPRASAAPEASTKAAVTPLDRGATTAVSPDRKVERTVDMAVRVKSGKLDDAVSKVGQVARQDGGYVADSSTALRTRGAGRARFTLRVATAKLDDAVGRLSALGTVTHQDQASTDITSSYDSAAQRLKDATAVRAALLKALGKATTSGEIASLRSRIADNRKTRAALSSQLASLGRRADLTTITLSLSAPTSGAAAAIDDNGTWSLGDAVRDTGHILGTVTGGLLVFGGAILPFAIIALVAWPVYRLRRRARREATLG